MLLLQDHCVVSILPATEQKVKKLFDIHVAYLLRKENLPFTKMQAICDLASSPGRVISK